MSLGGAPQAPKPPPFKKIDVGKAGDLFNQYQTGAYNLNDANYIANFPGLVALRDLNIAKSAQEVTGPLTPTAENLFTTEATAKSLGSFGGGINGGAGEAGSAARNATAAGVANQTQSYQDSALQNLQGEIQSNPQRLYDLTGDQALQIMIGNVVGQNQHAYQVYQSQVQQANANAASGASGTSAIIGAVLSVLKIAASAASDRRLKENIVRVGTSPSGLPISEWNYIGSNKRMRGVVAQDIEALAPDAVTTTPDGYMGVFYSRIDVELEEVAV